MSRGRMRRLTCMRRRLDLAIRGPLERADLAGLCARLRTLLGDDGARTVVCDVRGVAADAVLVDALARLQITARERGGDMRITHASAQLRELVAFMGLDEVLRAGG
jgi:ABC-type transporter Mla MlaB component